MDTRDLEIVLAVVKRAQKGDRESLSAVLRRINNLMFVYVYWLTLDHDLAEDLAQDVALHVLRYLNTLKITKLSAFWIWTYRTALDMLARRRSQGWEPTAPRHDIDNDDVALREITGLVAVPEHLPGGEKAIAVLDAMAALKFEHRHVLVLRCLGKMHYRQMARILGVANLETRWLFFRAKQSLKRQLAERQFEKTHVAKAMNVFGSITGQLPKIHPVAPVQASPNRSRLG